MKLRHTTAVGAVFIALAACSPEVVKETPNSFSSGNTTPSASVVKDEKTGTETQRFCVNAQNVRLPEAECEKAFGGSDRPVVVNNSGGAGDGLFWFFVGHMMGSSSNNYNPAYGQPVSNGYGRQSAATYSPRSAPIPAAPANYRAYSPTYKAPVTTGSSTVSTRPAISPGSSTTRSIAGSTASAKAGSVGG